MSDSMMHTIDGQSAEAIWAARQGHDDMLAISSAVRSSPVSATRLVMPVTQGAADANATGGESVIAPGVMPVGADSLQADADISQIDITSRDIAADTSLGLVGSDSSGQEYPGSQGKPASEASGSIEALSLAAGGAAAVNITNYYASTDRQKAHTDLARGVDASIMY